MTFNHYDIGSNPVSSRLDLYNKNVAFLFTKIKYKKIHLITDVLEQVDKLILGIGGRNIV